MNVRAHNLALQTIAVVPVAALAGAQDSNSLLTPTAEGEVLEIELDD